MAQIGLAAKLNRILSRPLVITPKMYQALGAILGGLCLGFLATVLYLAPKTATLGLVLLGLGLPAVLLLWYSPEFGLLGILFLAADFLPLDLVDIRLPMGGGLELRDLLLLGMLGLLILRSLARKALYVPWWPVGAPLAMFLVLALLSAAYALFWQDVETNWAFAELRDLSSYTLFFITAWVLDRKHHLDKVLIGLFVITDLTALIIFVQQFLGASQPLLPAMTASYWGIWNQGGGANSIGAIRVVPPSHVLMYFTMLIAGGLMMYTHDRRLRAVFAAQFAGLGLALLLTYTRSQWIATAIALILIAIVLVPTYKAQFIRLALISVPVLLLAYSLLQQTSLFTLLSERAMSLLSPAETMDSSSLQWRAFETEEALNSISNHPLMGVGLGNSYRRITTLQGEADGWYSGKSLVAGEVSRFTRYLHSSYLWIPVKMGIPAFIIFLWFCAAFLVAGWRLMRMLPDSQMKGIVLAVVTGFAGLLVWTVFHQHLVMNRSSTAVAFMAGLVAGIYFLQLQKQEEPFTGTRLSSAKRGDQ